tara:strand:+ start:367 stop:546 length:180 start_codon:yes stop_codon:yes gene_type:complete
MNISIVEGVFPILETVQSSKEFNDIGTSLLTAKKLKDRHKTEKEPSIVVITETIEDLIY